MEFNSALEFKISSQPFQLNILTIRSLPGKITDPAKIKLYGLRQRKTKPPQS